MLHRGPQLSDDLSARFDLLMRDYEQLKGNNGNAERKKLIKLIQSFRENVDTDYDHQAALGICAYALLKVDYSFGLFTVPKKESRYKLFGSNLGKLIQQTLKIHYDNPLDDQQALIYLTALYHHLKKYPRSLDGTFGENKESEDLLKEIEKNLKSLLEQLATKRPTYRALLHNFAGLETRYKEFGGTDASRSKYILFTQLLNEDFSDRYQFKAEEAREWTDAYAIRYAAMLYVFEEIASNYKYFSPEGGRLTKGSALYKACKEALNIDINKEISQTLKCNYYVTFLSYVVRALSQPHELEKWEKKGLTDPKIFFEELRNDLAEKAVDLMRITKPGRTTASYMDFVISYAAGYGVSMALGMVATEMSVKGTALTYMTLLRPEAALLITLLTCTAKSFVSKKATNAVKTVLFSTVSQPILFTFNTAINLGEFCYGLFVADKGEKVMEVIDSDDFMKALLSLPDSVWTPELKEKLKYVAAYGREGLSIGMENTQEVETTQENRKVTKIVM